MRYQRYIYDCGPSALINLLRCYGIKVRHSDVLAACGTTLEGTDEYDIQRGIVALGYEWSELSTSDRREAEAWLGCLDDSGPLLATTDHHEHWVVLSAGPVRGRVLLIDSAGTKQNRSENGCTSLTIETALNKVRAAKRLGDRYYMLCVLV